MVKYERQKQISMMHKPKSRSKNRIRPEEWLRGATRLEGREFERVRMIPQRWNNKAWKPFPDVGVYQMTRLTAKITGGSCNAYYIKLLAGESFPIHRHPNAFHIMIGLKGQATLCWREDRTKSKYRTTIRVGNGVFAVTPRTEHAIFANKGSDFIFLVINAHAENIHRRNYQVHVHR